MKPILVHCHIYYPELWGELKEYLKNIFVSYDLYVTTVEANKSLKEDILNFNDKAHFEIVENKGYDVGPFVHVINKVNLNNYSYVIKLHTKSNKPKGTRVHGFNASGSRWREELLSFLKECPKTLEFMVSHPNIGMVGGANLIISTIEDKEEIVKKKTSKLAENLGITYGKDYKFIAGTMFIAKSEIFKPIQNKLCLNDFEFCNRQGLTLAYQMERMLGMLVYYAGFKICDINGSYEICHKRNKMIDIFIKLLRFFYQKKISKSGTFTIKICKIPVFRIKEQTVDYYKYIIEKGKLTLLYLNHKISEQNYKEDKRVAKDRMLLSRCALGVAYNVYDGEELLEASIKSIRSVASYVVVVWQKISNFGEKASPKLEELLQRLKEQGMVDELYLYEPKFNQSDQGYNEKAKRDIGLQLVKKNGCNYFLSMDTDEFYHADQVQDALKYISKNKIGSSAVSIIEYLKEPIYQIVNGYTFSPAEYKNDYTFYVPFIMKIHHFKKQKHSSKGFPCLVDPTRGLNTNEKFYLFPKHLVAMHHFSTIRADLAKKYKNSNLRRADANDDLERLQNQILSYKFEDNLVQLSSFNRLLYIKKVPNVFNIDINEGKNDF